MRKKKDKNNSKKNNRKLLVEKSFNEALDERKKLEQEINETLDNLTVEELTELENGRFF